jgi:hypothetical protein
MISSLKVLDLTLRLIKLNPVFSVHIKTLSSYALSLKPVGAITKEFLTFDGDNMSGFRTISSGSQEPIYLATGGFLKFVRKQDKRLFKSFRLIGIALQKTLQNTLIAFSKIYPGKNKYS